jgi:transposase-like protein
MKIHCPNIECNGRFERSNFVRKGFYYRTSDRNHVQRWRCNACRSNFSYATFSHCCWQKKRTINNPLFELLSSNNSLRRCAKLLRINRKTVARRVPFLAARACASQKKFRRKLPHFQNIQFDDLETFEHTKCKPLSVAMVVEEKSRIILGFSVSRMPAKGRLSKKALFKYGFRPDERPLGWNQLFTEVKPLLREDAILTSDDNPHYPKFVKKLLPGVTHRTVKGGRGSSTGQGELKKLHFDPIFSLNHTFAMLRANICRLIRRTWCTTKNMQRLHDHISIYVDYHNRLLLKGS